MSDYNTDNYVSEEFDEDMDMVQMLIGYANGNEFLTRGLFEYYMYTIPLYCISLEERLKNPNYPIGERDNDTGHFKYLLDRMSFRYDSYHGDQNSEYDNIRHQFIKWYYTRHPLNMEIDTTEPLEDSTDPSVIRRCWNREGTRLMLLSEIVNINSHIMSAIDYIKEKYTFNRKISIVLIMQIFIYISKLMCLEPVDHIESLEDIYDENDLDTSHSIVNKLAPLVNETGSFTFNTFLYAYINDIILVGFPNKISTADGQHLCPYSFYTHDLDHVKDMYNSHLFLEETRNTYWKIIFINEKHKYLGTTLEGHKVLDLTQIKEIFLFVLWYQIHEDYPSASLHERCADFLETKLEDYSYDMDEGEISTFLDIYRYRDTLISILVRYAEKYPQSTVIGWLMSLGDKLLTPTDDDVEFYLGENMMYKFLCFALFEMTYSMT